MQVQPTGPKITPPDYSGIIILNEKGEPIFPPETPPIRRITSGLIGGTPPEVPTDSRDLMKLIKNQ